MVCEGATSKSKACPMVKGFSRLQVAVDLVTGGVPLLLMALSYEAPSYGSLNGEL